MDENLTKVNVYVNFETELWKKDFAFVVYGCDENLKEKIKNYKTLIYDFLDKQFEDSKQRKKVFAVLNAINSDPLNYCNEEKFKPLEGKVWEIKCHQLRIACIWCPKPKKLVAIYGIIKKTQKWPKKEMQNMRNQRDKYLNETNCIEENKHGRIDEI